MKNRHNALGSDGNAALPHGQLLLLLLLLFACCCLLLIDVDVDGYGSLPQSDIVVTGRLVAYRCQATARQQSVVRQQLDSSQTHCQTGAKSPIELLGDWRADSRANWLDSQIAPAD